jgi:hypothetical protein
MDVGLGAGDGRRGLCHAGIPITLAMPALGG